MPTERSRSKTSAREPDTLAPRVPSKGLNRIAELVEPMLGALVDGRVHEIGPLLKRHWELKTQISEPMPECVEAVFHEALAAGSDNSHGELTLACLHVGNGEQPVLLTHREDEMLRTIYGEVDLLNSAEGFTVLGFGRFDRTRRDSGLPSLIAGRLRDRTRRGRRPVASRRTESVENVGVLAGLVWSLRCG